MKYPFVSRARFEDRERDVLELKRERAELKEHVERLTDEINFRSTGFHLYARYEKKRDDSLAVEQPKTPEVEPTGIAAAIAKVGPRMTAVRGYMEATQGAEFDKQEKAIAEQQERDRQAMVAKRLEDALAVRKKPAAQA